MTTPKPAFDSVRLGNDSTGLTVQLLPFPRSDAPLLEKVQSFAYFEDVIRQHRSQLTAATIQQAYADNIPVSSSASASEEANRVGLQLYASFFHIENLTCLGFFKSDGTEASVALEACDRSADISYIQFEATIEPARFNSALVDTPPSTVKYFLRLPQSMPPPKQPASNKATSDKADLAESPESPDADTDTLTAIRNAFAAGGDPSTLNFSNPIVARAFA
jgi:hypothetical protein